MPFDPTKEQSLAIDEKGSIIVSAAAGSGKTAVLVERVIKMLTAKHNPLLADKLLVVTFTNAAAAELRSRIEKRLGEEIAEHPDNILLQRQQILVSNAKICTIDSFCLDFIRENFEKIGINPSFKIADKSTLMAFERRALSEVINSYFDSNDKDFLALLDFLGDDYDDSILQKTVSFVFEYSRHMPSPKLWLKSVISGYKMHAEKQSDEWFRSSLKYVKNIAVDALLEIQQALKIVELSCIAYEKYSPNYLYFKELVENIILLSDEEKWNDVFNLLGNIIAPPLKKLDNEEKTPEILQSVEHRDNAKKYISNIKDIVYADKDTISDEIKYIEPFVSKIVEIVNMFEDRLYELLKENDLITFYMAEQTVLNVLTEEKDGTLICASNINEFIEQYDAIMVDEYQDTNTLQDTLFNILSNNGEKLFCVGDMKQCIYKFRGSNPLNFLIKKQNSKDISTRTARDMLRVDLGCNFRSRRQICDYINSLFEKIIYTENSDFDYNDKEKLDSRAEYPENSDVKVENHFVDFSSIKQNPDTTFETRIQADAAVVAEVIKEIMLKEPFLRDGKGLRKAKYSDITILLHTMRGKDATYISELQKQGIPVSVSASEVIGSDEVNSLISMLRVLSSPSDDIALVTVLTSPVFAFSMEELAVIRTENRYANFYSSLLMAAKNGNAKADNFVRIISALRRRSAVLPLGVLIDEIFEETNLLNLYSAQENGDIKRLNLLSVQNLALEFDANKNEDIKSFVNYFDELENRDFSLSSDSVDSVKIMSIHKSKGLQFPICILANTTNRFNEQDIKDSVILSEQCGFSLVYYDQDGKLRNSCVLRNLMKFEEKRNLLAEELRLFYVALTRAEEKLITVSTYDNLADEIIKKSDLINISGSEKRVEYPLFRKNNSYADWLLESLILDGKSAALRGKAQDAQIIVHNEIKTSKYVEEELLDRCDTADLKAVAELKNTYSYRYPYSELLQLQAKASVTDIVHKADEKNYRFTTRPAFMQSGGLTSAERGTAIHKFMQTADYVKCKSALKSELDTLYENMFISQTEYESLDEKLLQQFFDSALCDRIIASNTVKREMKFLTEFSAGELMEGLDESCKNEPIVVQGAVDLLFIEDGEIVIVDFKSDSNKNEAELIAAYENQLKIYAKACSKIMKLPIRELIIYAYSLGKEIIVK